MALGLVATAAAPRQPTNETKTVYFACCCLAPREVARGSPQFSACHAKVAWTLYVAWSICHRTSAPDRAHNSL